MSCRSCGIGPKKTTKIYTKPKIEMSSSRPHPSKGIITNSDRKVTVPTKSPTRTYNTLGE